jgi:3',5'-cyclic AMP phosphodiesterase CpdA
VAACLLHVSDLHVGTHEAPDAEHSLAALVEQIRPDAIAASGDLTNRGRRDQHERAARFLRSFGVPVVAVPGNHDLPYTFPARFVRPWAQFERVWETTEPVFSSGGLHVVGLNSARPFRHQGGALHESQLRGAAERLAAAPDGAYRVVVLHHHLIGAPWRAARKRPVSRRNHVLQSLIVAGADLIIAGHIHQSAVSERHEFEVVGEDVRSTVVSIAPGLGQPRPRRLGEARGLQVYDVGDATLAVRTFIWQDGGWRTTARREFPR